MKLHEIIQLLQLVYIDRDWLFKLTPDGYGIISITFRYRFGVENYEGSSVWHALPVGLITRNVTTEPEKKLKPHFRAMTLILTSHIIFPRFH